MKREEARALIEESEYYQLPGLRQSTQTMTFTPPTPRVKTKIVSGASDYLIKLWDLVTGDFISTLFAHSEILSLGVAFDDKVVSACGDNTIKVWDFSSRSCVRNFDPQSGPVYSLQVIGDKIIGGFDKGVVKIMDVSTGRLLKSFNVRSHCPVYCVEVVDDKAITTSDDCISVWNLATGSCTIMSPPSMQQLHRRYLQVVGDKIITGCKDTTITIWDMKTLKALRKYRDPHRENLYCLTAEGLGMPNQGEGERLFSGHHGCINIWDMNVRRRKTLRGHDGPINCIKMSDGVMVSASSDQTIKVWDVKNSCCTNTLKGHGNSVTCLQLL